MFKGGVHLEGGLTIEHSKKCSGDTKTPPRGGSQIALSPIRTATEEAKPSHQGGPHPLSPSLIGIQIPPSIAIPYRASLIAHHPLSPSHFPIQGGMGWVSLVWGLMAGGIDGGGLMGVGGRGGGLMGVGGWGGGSL